MRSVALTAAGLLLALVLTLVVFGVEPLQGLRLIADGAFGDKFGIARTFVRATPLLLCGLGVTVAWRAGMYNVGGEGQYVLGGVVGAAAARGLGTAAPLLTQGAVLAGSVAGGALLAALAGWLQVKRGVQCVISTILLNFIVLQFLAYTVRGPLQESNKELPQTDRLADSVMFARFDRQTDFHSGVFLAVGACALVWVFFKLTQAGFWVTVVGQNARLARVNRVDPGRVQLGAMALSGALCGFAGGVDYLGVIGQVGDGFSQNWGFLAIPVALLGGLSPAGVLGSSVYFGALMAGGEGLSRFNTAGTTIVYVIQAVAVLGFVGLTHVRLKGKSTHV